MISRVPGEAFDSTDRNCSVLLEVPCLRDPKINFEIIMRSDLEMIFSLLLEKWMKGTHQVGQLLLP
jgi:hypothetical protein